MKDLSALQNVTNKLLLFCRGHMELSFNSPHISLSSAFVGARMPYYGRPMPPADGFVPI